MTLKEQARLLRADGLIYKDISARLNVPLATVASWCDDRAAEKLRARKVSKATVYRRAGFV